MNFQKKAVVFTSSDPVYVLSILESIKTARNSDRIIEDAAMFLFPNNIREPEKVVLSYRVIGDRRQNKKR